MRIHREWCHWAAYASSGLQAALTEISPHNGFPCMAVPAITNAPTSAAPPDRFEPKSRDPVGRRRRVLGHQPDRSRMEREPWAWPATGRIDCEALLDQLIVVAASSAAPKRDAGTGPRAARGCTTPALDPLGASSDSGRQRGRDSDRTRRHAKTRRCAVTLAVRA